MSHSYGRFAYSRARRLPAPASRYTRPSGGAGRRMHSAGRARAAIAAMIGLSGMLLGVVIAPRVVSGHSAYVRSSPAHGSTVTSAPALLEMWFNAPLFARTDANYVEIVNVADDKVVFRGEGTIDSADNHHLLVGLPATLLPGDYEVIWQTLSALDGDRADGSFLFAVDPAGVAREVPPFRTTADSPSIGPTDRAPRHGGGSGVNGGADLPAWARQTGPAVLLLAGTLAVISLLKRQRD